MPLVIQPSRIKRNKLRATLRVPTHQQEHPEVPATPRRLEYGENFVHCPTQEASGRRGYMAGGFASECEGAVPHRGKTRADWTRSK